MIKGRDYAEFCRRYQERHAQTRILIRHASEIQIMHLVGEDDDSFLFILFDQDSGMKNLQKGRKIKFLKEKFAEKQIAAVREHQFAMYCTLEHFILIPDRTNVCIHSLMKWLGLRGAVNFTDLLIPGIERSLFFSQCFRLRGSLDIRLLMRKPEKGIAELTGIVSGRYFIEEEDLISNIVHGFKEEFGNMLLCEWEFSEDNERYGIYMEFERLRSISDDVRYGVVIRSSNTLKESFHAALVLRVNEAMIPVEQMMLRHSQRIQADQVVEYLYARCSVMHDIEKLLSQSVAITEKNLSVIAHDRKLYRYFTKKRFSPIFKNSQEYATKQRLICESMSRYVKNVMETDSYIIGDDVTNALYRLYYYILCDQSIVSEMEEKPPKK